MNNPPLFTSRPRISSNQLGEFVFATDSKKLRILRDQKNGNPFRSPYYQTAQNAVLGSFRDGHFDVRALREAANNLRSREAKSRNQVIKYNNNAEMLRKFSEVAGAAVPVVGEYNIVRRNALMEIGGVDVSVRPEITTMRHDRHEFSYTKFRFSKSKASEDESEIILLLLLKYGSQQASDEMHFDLKASRLVDCFAQRVVDAERLSRLREAQLNNALLEICRLWPTIP